MKRRNAECGKIRRPIKRTKIAEGIYGSTFLYLKFLLVWALVLLADFILEFRFEYLWPFWLLLRSVYDSFKFQGLAFSVFFIFIALTSDMICFLFIPVHWLFFAASTYVWVQYVWHTERGICLPTISLWLLFVYIEASVRLKELKNLPFNLDLCRPFAAHCIGYPVVTLGFGFKSYVGYRMRLRKQKDVARENDFYLQLLQQALPSETPSLTAIAASDKASLKFGEEVISNGHCSPNVPQSPQPKKSNFVLSNGTCHNTSPNAHPHVNSVGSGGREGSVGPPSHHVSAPKYSELDGGGRGEKGRVNNVPLPNTNSGGDKQDYQYMENHVVAKRTVINVNDFDEIEEGGDKLAFKVNGLGSLGASLPPPSSAAAPNAPTSKGNNNNRWNHHKSLNENGSISQGSGGKKNKNNAAAKELTNNHINNQKDDHSIRLESDIKRLKADLQASRQCEQDLRSQIHSLTSGEKSVKNELSQFQLDNENLQNKLHNLVTARQQDKSTISLLEKKLQDERRVRTSVESQLSTERKAKKAEDAAAARAVAVATASRAECSENCKARRRDLENDLKQLRREIKMREEQYRQMEREAQSLRQYKDSHGDTDVLMSALSAMTEKNSHLENSLSAETRVKLDLFSALGEAKRQLEIAQTLLMQKEKEIGELKSRIAEVMAVMPVTNNSVYSTSVSVSMDSGLAPLIYSPKFLPDDSCMVGNCNNSNKSQLDPNASVYTPKAVPSDI